MADAAVRVGRDSSFLRDQRSPGTFPENDRILARGYGARVEKLLGKLGDGRELGEEVAPGLFEVELNYLRDQEWARSADDVLWRRTKLGLHYSAAQRAAVASWCNAHWGRNEAAAATTRPERTWN